MLKAVPIAIVLILVLALTCATVTVQFDGIEHVVTAPPTPEPTPTAPTLAADCANIGLDYPANPFRGWPVSAANWGVVTAYYCSASYFANFGFNHFGIDLGLPSGTDVFSTATGSVTAAGNHPLMGLHVIVCTPTNWCSIYMHLSALQVSQWQTVTNGQLIGNVGSTGNSTGPHLHYEIRQPDGSRIDPTPAMQ